MVFYKSSEWWLIKKNKKTFGFRSWILATLKNKTALKEQWILATIFCRMILYINIIRSWQYVTWQQYRKYFYNIISIHSIHLFIYLMSWICWCRKYFDNIISLLMRINLNQHHIIIIPIHVNLNVRILFQYFIITFFISYPTPYNRK